MYQTHFIMSSKNLLVLFVDEMMLRNDTYIILARDFTLVKVLQCYDRYTT